MSTIGFSIGHIPRHQHLVNSQVLQRPQLSLHCDRISCNEFLALGQQTTWLTSLTFQSSCRASADCPIAVRDCQWQHSSDYSYKSCFSCFCYCASKLLAVIATTPVTAAFQSIVAIEICGIYEHLH
eukprot:11125-Heterococcus_DN1.PRE.1